MIEVGRMIVKLAGRDAGLKGVIVEILDDKHILIDGEVRRRKCNILHVEPLDKVLKIKSKASHADVISALKAENIEVKDKKSKTVGERPKKVRKSKKVVQEEAKKPTKKEEKPIKK